MVHCEQRGPWLGCGVYTLLVLKVQRVPRKYLTYPHNYTNLNHTYWQDESTCSCCLHQNSEQLNATAETHQTRQWFSSLLLSNFGVPVLIVASFPLAADRNDTQCGPLLLQGPTCWPFKNGSLHTLVVTSGYLRHCRLSVFWNQSVQFSSDLWPQKGI